MDSAPGRIIRPDAPPFAVQCRKAYSLHGEAAIPALAAEHRCSIEAVEAALFTRVRG